MGDNGGDVLKVAMAMLALTACAATATACASTSTRAYGAMTMPTPPTTPQTTASPTPTPTQTPTPTLTPTVQLSLRPSLSEAKMTLVGGGLQWLSRRTARVDRFYTPWTCFDGALVVDGAVVQAGKPTINIQLVTPILGDNIEFVSIRWDITAAAEAALRAATPTTTVTMRFCQDEHVIENVAAVQALLTKHDPQPGL